MSANFYQKFDGREREKEWVGEKDILRVDSSNGVDETHWQTKLLFLYLAQYSISLPLEIVRKPKIF